MKKNKEIIVMVVLAVVFLFIFNRLPNISLAGSTALVVLGFVLAIGYVQLLRKKDELQQHIIQNALATAFVVQMGGYLAIAMIEFIRGVKAHYESWMLLLSGLILFIISLFLTRSRYRIGKRDEE